MTRDSQKKVFSSFLSILSSSHKRANFVGCSTPRAIWGPAVSEMCWYHKDPRLRWSMTRNFEFARKSGLSAQKTCSLKRWQNCMRKAWCCHHDFGERGLWPGELQQPTKLALWLVLGALIRIFSLHFIDSTYEKQISKKAVNVSSRSSWATIPKGSGAANFIGSWRALFEDILRRRRKTRIHFFNNEF